MNLMICMRGEPQQLPFLPAIAELGAGIELGSYGLIGVRSEQDWQTRIAMHKAVRAQFHGAIALHGPFIGMEYAHIDHLIRDVVHRRMDMIFEVAVTLKASRVVLHSGYTREIDLFKLQHLWLNGCIEFWQGEVRRWAGAGIKVVLENDTEMSPDLLIQLVNKVDNPSLGLCMDIGHQHMFSDLDAIEWVRRMGDRLAHVHLHDNDRSGDHHWPIGRGTIDFEPFYAEVMRQAPEASISLEVDDKVAMELRLGDLRQLAVRLASLHAQ